MSVCQGLTTVGLPLSHTWLVYRYVRAVVHLRIAGFPATLEIRENLENEFPIFQSGETQRIWEKHNKSGKTQGISHSDPEGTDFRQFG